jgi:hypothetical protein
VQLISRYIHRMFIGCPIWGINGMAPKWPQLRFNFSVFLRGEPLGQKLLSDKPVKPYSTPAWPDWAEFRILVVCLLWAVFKKNHRSSANFGLLFSIVRVMYTFFTKMGWATFWAIFLQTHLVTLLYTHMCVVGIPRPLAQSKKVLVTRLCRSPWADPFLKRMTKPTVQAHFDLCRLLQPFIWHKNQ